MNEKFCIARFFWIVMYGKIPIKMVKYVLIACVLIASLGIGGLAPDCASNIAAGPLTAHVPCHTSFVAPDGGFTAIQYQLTVILAAVMLACLHPPAPTNDLLMRTVALPRSARPKPLTPPPRPVSSIQSI